MTTTALFAGSRLAGTPVTADDGTTAFQLQVAATFTGGDASAANQTSQITQETLINTRLGDITSPAAGSVNARLATLNTTLGTPMQNTGGTVAVTQATASSLNATVTGPVANLSTAATNPFPLAARFLTTPPTYTNTQLGELGMSSNGGLRISMGVRTNYQDGFNANTMIGVSSSDGNSCLLVVSPYIFNGNTLDRIVKANATSRILSSAATTNATSAKASAGNIFMMTGRNAAATVIYLKIYNKASAPTVGTDTPIQTFALSPQAPFTFDWANGRYFSTGIAYAFTTGSADNDTGAVAAADILGFNLDYS